MTPARFISIRQQLGMTQKELAELLGRHPNTVARYERGELDIPKIVAALMQASIPSPQ